MLEGVKLARKIGGNPALAQFELEIMPGAAVGDDQLADVIASNLASHGHPTATAPMGGPQDPRAVVDSHGAPRGSTHFVPRRIDHAGRSIGGDEPHDDHDCRADREGRLRNGRDTWRCPGPRNRGARRPRPLARTITGTR